MSVWTPELKEQVKQMYLDAEPTPESSTEIIKDIAEELEQSPNGIRQVLVQAGVIPEDILEFDKVLGVLQELARMYHGKE